MVNYSLTDLPAEGETWQLYIRSQAITRFVLKGGF